jgi:formylglycine-generating enzyme required for sulfatase activity
MQRLNGRVPGRLAQISLAALISLSACASGPAATAEKMTRAMYAGDVAGATASMDTDLAKKVTSSDISEVSESMQKLGTMQSFTLSKSAVDQRKYEYVAQFDKGTMNVDVAFDPDGKVSDFHVFDGD